MPGTPLDTAAYASAISTLPISVADILEGVGDLEAAVASFDNLPGGNTHFVVVSETSGKRAWDVSEGWPRTVAIWGGRLVLGGNTRQPNRIWFSQAGDYRNFYQDLSSGEVVSDSPFFRDIGDISEIRAIHPITTGLGVFTRDNTWELPNQIADATQQSTVSDRSIGAIGASHTPPASSSQVTMFCGRNNEALFALGPSPDFGGSVVENITQQTNPNITESVDSMTIGYPRGYGSSNFWAGVRRDGRMVVLNLDKVGFMEWSMSSDYAFSNVIEAGDDLYALVYNRSRNNLGLFIFERPPVSGDTWTDTILDDTVGQLDIPYGSTIKSLGIAAPYPTTSAHLRVELDRVSSNLNVVIGEDTHELVGPDIANKSIVKVPAITVSDDEYYQWEITSENSKYYFKVNAVSLTYSTGTRD